MTSHEERRPFEFDVPEDYEQRIEEARGALDVVPRNENWENAQRVLADPPSREAIESAQREAAQAMAMLAEFQEARHTGRDPDQTTAVVVDAAGRLTGLEFGVEAARLGNHGLSSAISLAWADAETVRAESGSEFASRGRGLGAGGDATAEQVLRDIEAAVAAREHERFERTTEDGLCKLTVDLRGRLTEVVFLQNNVFGLTDRQTLAQQVTAAATAAQSAASEVVSEISAVHYARLG